MSKKFVLKRKRIQRFVAQDRSKNDHFTISRVLLPWPWSEIGKICHSRTHKDFTAFRIPPAHKRKKKWEKQLTISASTRCSEPTETAKCCLYGWHTSSVAVFYVELCLFCTFVFVFFLSPFSYFYRLSKYPTSTWFYSFLQKFSFVFFFLKARWPRNFLPENTRVAAQG